MSKFYRNGKGILRFFAGSGKLYLLFGGTVLALLCAVTLLSSPKDPEVLGNTDTPAGTVASDGASDTVTDTATDGTADTGSGADSDAQTNAPAEDIPPDDVMMILPVSGTVGQDFSLTVPVFSETMNDWRVHQGIDFLTDGEVEVKAAAAGIVDNVYVSELMGLTVEILHADGTLSVYQSLSGEAEVIEGQEVLQGDVIGKTGLSADSECLAGNHLHFALIREGVYLDPNDRFTP